MKKILFIEDDPAMLKLLQSRFGEEDIQLSVAVEPEEGIRKVTEELPDLVVLDLLLPGKSGLEVLRQIRAIPKIKNTAVLVLTIVNEKEIMQEAQKLGVVDYIVKGTVSLEELENKVKSVLLSLSS